MAALWLRFHKAHTMYLKEACLGTDLLIVVPLGERAASQVERLQDVLKGSPVRRVRQKTECRGLPCAHLAVSNSGSKGIQPTTQVNTAVAT